MLVRDELTAVLDVSARAAILELLAELQSSLDIGVGRVAAAPAETPGRSPNVGQSVL